MTEASPKEVNWHDYCPKCVYAKASSFEEPCNTCLEEFTNEGTDRPTKFEEGRKK